MMKHIAHIVETTAQTVVGGYQKIENTVVGVYKTIEKGTLSGFSALTDKCVALLFAKEGETAADAKARLSGK